MRERVAAARVARLATVDPSGRPHLVPVTLAVAGNTLYSAVDEKPKSTRSLQRLRNIAANPIVAVLVDHYEDDWDRLWWVRVRGAARVLEEGAERDRALAALAAKYPPYRDAPPTGPVIAITADEWLGWSASQRGMAGSAG